MSLDELRFKNTFDYGYVSLWVVFSDERAFWLDNRDNTWKEHRFNHFPGFELFPLRYTDISEDELVEVWKLLFQ